MDRSLRRVGGLQRNLKVLNQKEERDLQHRLSALDRQYRWTRKRLQQRRDSLVTDLRRVVMVKVVEPQATVNIAMREIGEHTCQTAAGRRSYSSKSQYRDGGREPAESSRSTPVQPAGSVRRRGRVQSSVSLMQMKNIATIDSISEQELARRQRLEREDSERLRQILRETLSNRVAAFIETLRDKSDMEVHVKPP